MNAQRLLEQLLDIKDSGIDLKGYELDVETMQLKSVIDLEVDVHKTPGESFDEEQVKSDTIVPVTYASSLKPGDRVMFRSNLSLGQEYNGWTWDTDKHESLSGKIAEVEESNSLDDFDFKVIASDGLSYWACIHMIEGKVEE